MSDTARALYVFYIFFTIAETVLLMFGGMNLYDALVHTFGTVGTGGFSPYNDSVAHFDSTYIKMVITAFMALCGVNFNLYFGLFKKGSRNILADAELKLYIFIIVLVTALIFAALLITGEYSSVGDAAVDSSFQTVSILTTTGYTTANYENWPVFCQMLILILMFIGGCSSSTSGGIKIIRIMVILKLIKRGFAMRLHPNVVETVKLNGRTMPSDTVSAISSHLFLYIAMVFVGAFIISFENVDIITCFSSVITCLGNIGPGFGLVGPANTFAELSGPSKLLLSLYMIAGRLELYTLFILFTPRFWSKNN
jgi:trk system potassium uptake protein TrkH